MPQAHWDEGYERGKEDAQAGRQPDERPGSADWLDGYKQGYEDVSRKPRTAEEAAAHISDVINSASGFFNAGAPDMAARLEVVTKQGERFLVTVTVLD